MSIKAKFPGYCPVCRRRFLVGQDDIEKDDATQKWRHVNCQLNFSHRNNAEAYELPTKSFPATDAMADHLSSILDDLSSDVVHEEPVFTPSVYQKAIYEAIENMVKGVSSFMHLVIEAVAGSGKTTTIVQALKIIPDTFDIAFIAFNKHIAIELKKRAPGYVHVSTLHSLGLEVIRNNVEKVVVDKSDNKMNDILNDLYPVKKSLVIEGKLTKEQQKRNYAKRAGMRSLASLAKSTLIDATNIDEVEYMIDRYGIDIDFNERDELIEALPKVLDICKSNPQLVSFDDMIWLPVVLNMTFVKFDFLMVDEAQDMNKTQIKFIMNSISDNGHVIAVGDRFQSLYGFRGADTDAIPNIIELLNAETLPLSVTYRCPKLHVELAQRIVPQIEARDNAPDGEVIQDFPYRNLVRTVQDGDMVICRTNHPLVAPAFACIRAGKKAVIRGKDGIGNQMIALVKRFNAERLSELEANLSEYYNNEFQKLVDHGKELQAAMLTDKVETLRFIMGTCDTVQEVITRIETLFDDTSHGVVFSSVHRAKGLEAENVFILKPELMPHPKAKEGTWEEQQEQNVIYVAQTRSKDKIYMVKGGEDF